MYDNDPLRDANSNNTHSIVPRFLTILEGKEGKYFKENYLFPSPCGDQFIETMLPKELKISQESNAG